jgi:16S rRNA (adenine1518-N6/adenine1519-N6)-dimethyltransferase
MRGAPALKPHAMPVCPACPGGGTKVVCAARWSGRCPVRLAWSRTQPFQGCDTGSNPVRDVLHCPVPRKRLGQHFLTDPGILRRIVEFADPGPDDTILEIGPGHGHLTRLLAERVRRVIAVELDADLIGPLRASVPANVEVIQGDGLEVDYPTIAREPYAIVANLPYNVATPLLERFVEARAHISSVTVLVQKEVADRILAPPRSRVYGPLSVGIQRYAIPRTGFLVPPGAFRPPPRVHSRVIRLDWRDGVADAPGFRAFVSRVFSARRKTLLNNLVAMFPDRGKPELERRLEELGLDPGSRADSLTPGQLFAIWQAMDGTPASGGESS